MVTVQYVLELGYCTAGYGAGRVPGVVGIRVGADPACEGVHGRRRGIQSVADGRVGERKAGVGQESEEEREEMNRV